MVTVALHPLGDVILPVLYPRLAAATVLCRPFIVSLVDDEHAVFVSELIQILTVRVVRATDMVETKRLQQLDALLDSTRVGSGAKGTKRMVVGNAFKQHLLTIEFEAELRTELYRAHAKSVGDAVENLAVVVRDRCHDSIKIRIVEVPKMGIGKRDIIKFILVAFLHTLILQVVVTVSNDMSLRIQDVNIHLARFVLAVVGNGCLHMNRLVVGGRDIQRMTVKIDCLRCDDELHVTVQSCTGIPTRVVRVTRVGFDDERVFLTIFQQVTDIDAKTEVSIFRATDTLSVEIDIADEHDAANLEVYSPTLPGSVRSECATVPADTHFLETTGGETTLDIGCQI